LVLALVPLVEGSFLDVLSQRRTVAVGEIETRRLLLADFDIAKWTVNHHFPLEDRKGGIGFVHF
jgi:hypothetical protein